MIPKTSNEDGGIKMMSETGQRYWMDQHNLKVLEIAQLQTELAEAKQLNTNLETQLTNRSNDCIKRAVVIKGLQTELAEERKVSARKERKLSFLIDVLEDGRCMMGDDLHEHLERLDDE